MSKIKLGDFIERYGDGIHGTPNYDDKGTHYFINGNNLTNGKIQITDETLRVTEEEYEKVKRPLCNNTLLLSINGTLGRVAIYKGENIALGKSVCYLNVKDDKNKYFVKYVLNTQEFQKYIQLVAHGSNIKNLAPSQVVEYEFNAPNEKDQEKIAFLLKLIDDKIDNNNEMNVQLEAMAKTIYDYWFLQFDFPDENGNPYKSSGGKMVRNEELKIEIPESWRVGTLNPYIFRDKGGDWGKEREEGNYIRKVSCLRGADFPSITGTTTLMAPKRFILEKNTDKFLENGDLIIEISGGSPTQSTGRICYINDSLLERFDTDVITSNFCKAISLKNVNYMYWFYVQWKKIYESNILFKYEGKTTGIKNLLFDMFIKDYKIVQPVDELIFKYNEKVADIFEKIQKNQKESQELASLRDFLLPLLMNGQIKFREC